MELNRIRFIGRHILKNGKEYFSYSGCGFEFTVYTNYLKSSVTLVLDSELREYENQYIGIFINNEFASREKLKNGRSEIKVLLSDSIGKNTIRIIKLNETYFSSIYLNDIVLSNAVFDEPDPSYKKTIGFFGDSITCGFGNLDYHGQEFKMETEDFRKTYAYLTAEALQMEYSVVARGGISVSIPIYNDKLIGDIYDTVDMYEKCVPDRDLDYAVINLGANDNSGYLQMIKDEDKPKALQIFKDKYLDLIDRIIKDNPSVKIVMCYHMLPLESVIIEAIKDVYKCASKSYKNRIELLECVPNSDGGCCHPYWTAHEDAAKLLIEVIQKL